MFLGEAPGSDEDRLGKPLLVLAASYWTKCLAILGWIAQKFLHLELRLLTWHRKPNPAEVAACLPSTQRHIELVRPKFWFWLRFGRPNPIDSSLKITRARGNGLTTRWRTGQRYRRFPFCTPLICYGRP